MDTFENGDRAYYIRMDKVVEGTIEMIDRNRALLDLGKGTVAIVPLTLLTKDKAVLERRIKEIKLPFRKHYAAGFKSLPEHRKTITKTI
ncbi:MAG: hypothetical protein KKB59_18445 [Spirochaetes bacterium]|nr:hypothetical protein [Spirochaetota bacterium]